MNKNNQIWYSVEIKTAAQTTDAIEFALDECGAEGSEINLLSKKNLGEDISVFGYFLKNPNEDFLLKKIAEALRIYEFDENSVQEIAIREVENQDWLAEWKKNWKPLDVGNFIVAPTWSEIENAENKIVIRIEPGMAFGTGTHETTKLCLKAIEENFDGGRFFDVGTGTGILAITARKLFPNCEISACDVDEDSIPIAHENAGFNEVNDIDFFVGSISQNSPDFDFVCANLTADVIVPLLPLLVSKAKKKLVLSGILDEQKDWVCGEIETKFRIPESKLKIETDGMWISILIDIEKVNL